MAGCAQILANSLGHLRVNRHRFAFAPLAIDPYRIEAAVLMQISHLERRDFGSAKPNLQSNGQDRSVPQSLNCVRRRRIEQSAEPALRKMPASSPVAG